MDQNAVIPIFSGASNWLGDNNSASCNEYRSREETGTLLLAAVVQRAMHFSHPRLSSETVVNFNTPRRSP